MRALLDLLRENEAEVQAIRCNCKHLLQMASSQLKILDPRLGEEKLIKSVAVEFSKVDI